VSRRGDLEGRAIDVPASFNHVVTSWTFWSLAVAFSVYTVTVTIVRVFGIALLQEEGLPPRDARFVMSSLALWGIIGKLVFGALTDYLPSRVVATVAFVLAAVGTLLLLGSATASNVAAFAVVYGLPMGGIASLQPVLVAKYFGQRAFGTVYGMLVLILTLGAAVGPVIAGRVYDLGGGYAPTLIACVVASAAVAVLIATIRSTPAGQKTGVTMLES
jgi:MFS family permease